jgi:D-alanyl-D-alanine dipeptidase
MYSTWTVSFAMLYTGIMNRNRFFKNKLSRFFLLGLLGTSFGTTACTPRKTVRDSLDQIQHSPEFVQIIPGDSIAIDLRYATTNNFVGKDMYGEFKSAYLHQEAALSLQSAALALQKIHPAWKLIIYDALRPRSVQYVLWDKVKGTPEQQYVADPAQGSVHNYGMAVDLSIVDEHGKAIDMGTPYDTFDPLAQPQLEEQFLRERRLNAKQIQNRKLLRKLMQDAGFIQLPHEWWHYDRFPKNQVRARFPIVE